MIWGIWMFNSQNFASHPFHLYLLHKVINVFREHNKNLTFKWNPFNGSFTLFHLFFVTNIKNIIYQAECWCLHEVEAQLKYLRVSVWRRGWAGAGTGDSLLEHQSHAPPLHNHPLRQSDRPELSVSIREAWVELEILINNSNAADWWQVTLLHSQALIYSAINEVMSDDGWHWQSFSIMILPGREDPLFDILKTLKSTECWV